MESRVELFEQIRRDREFAGLSIRALARRHGVHRRAVRQALESPIPPPKRKPSHRPAPALASYRALIDGWLADDLKAPPKQRHTARRIHRRLLDEHGAEVAESTVRDYVRRRRRELGFPGQAFCPQVHDPGVTAEVDWGEAKVLVCGSLTVVGLFLMRACFSGACFVSAFETQSQQAFFEGHVAAFQFFGGVFRTVRYDNLKAAAKSTLKGRKRIESERFVALRSHYLYSSWFTLPGKEGAHEKGGVEGEVGRFRRNHLVPVPEVSSLAELNERLRASCTQDLARTIESRPQTVGEMLAREAPHLRALPAEPFPTWEESSHRVSAKAMIAVRRNHYSVPVALVGLRVAVKVGAREIRVLHEDKEVAAHPRLRGSGLRSARLDHYLELLERKPGALAHSLALRQERERGAWPGCFDELWRAIEERTSPSEAARQMVEVLLLVREHGLKRTELAVRGVLAAGAHDGRAVALLARRSERAHAAPLSDLDERLAATERPEPTLGRYDELLAGGGGR
jgi:transposase